MSDHDNQDTHDNDPNPTQTSAGDVAPLERVGRYVILQKIGEGGMGEVYHAEQRSPVRRAVALKLIKAGMDSKEVVARFESERQALALMNHPNVARVFDAGVTDRGRPFFVMEYIQGEPITTYADKHRLSIDERLGLFIQVCQGVQHAHQRAIIHRDLKPSNVLVATRDGDPMPKIIDFGVAKATTQRLTDKTMFTTLGMLVGTPEFMSPEQAEMTGLDIDTRTDVYSLGMLLYDLLVGALPFDKQWLKQSSPDDIRRKIREDEPPKPSARVSKLGDVAVPSARNRRTDQRGLARALSGDLDWITMKALDKDRSRRYDSPAELANDVRRHLRHQPVLASPPSTIYLLRKFVRRHRFGVATAAVAIGVLIAFALNTSIHSRRVARQAETSERVSRFLTDLLGSLDPYLLGQSLWSDLETLAAMAQDGDSAAMRQALAGVNSTVAAQRLVDEQILSPASARIEQELGEEPQVAARLEQSLGETYRKLGLYDKAAQHAHRAVELSRLNLGPDHPQALRSAALLCWVYARGGRYEQAEPICVETLDSQKSTLGLEHTDTLRSMHNLAFLYYLQHRLHKAEALYLELAPIQNRVLGAHHRDTLWSKNGLGIVYLAQGRVEEAKGLYVQTLAVQRQVLGNEDSHTLWSIDNLAECHTEQGRYEEAEQLYLEVVTKRQRILGDRHPDTLVPMSHLARLYHLQHRNRQAEQVFLQTVSGMRDSLGNDHDFTHWAIETLANFYAATGNEERARPLTLELTQLRRRAAETAGASAAAKIAYAQYLLHCEPADLRDPATALTFALEAAELSGHNNAHILETLSWAYHHNDQPDMAVQTVTQAIRLLHEEPLMTRATLEAALETFEAAMAQPAP